MLGGLHLVLTLIWAGLLGSIDHATLASGFLVSYCVLFIIYRNRPRARSYFRKPPLIVGFVIYYIYELIKSNVTVAIDIVTPTHFMKPGVVAIPLRAKTDLEITMLANLITMTPGTLSLDVSDDRKTLYIHAMYAQDVEALRADITNNLERRVLEILR